MRGFSFRLALPFFYPEEGAGPAASDPAPAPGGSSAPAPGAPVGSTPAAPAAPAAPQFTYKEDRSSWVPSHVVRERTERAAKLERELDYERRRVAALSGVQAPAAPADPEQEVIRGQFAKLYPGLAKLEAMADKLEKAAGFDYDAVQNSSQQVWVAHGNRVLNELTEAVKTVYGGADLTPKAQKRIQQAFVSEIAEDPQMRARYEAGDMSIISEFVKDYTGSNLDPYRRSTQAAAAPSRELARRLPRGGGGSAIPAKPATLKPSDGDAYHKAAFERFSQG